MPPISYERSDATAMSIAFKKMESKVGLLSEGLDSSKESLEGILKYMTNMENRLPNLESSKYSSHSDAESEFNMLLSCKDCGTGSLSPLNNLRDNGNLKNNVGLSKDEDIESSLPTDEFINENTYNNTGKEIGILDANNNDAK